MLASRVVLRRLACPNGECGEFVSEEVRESYVLVAPCGSCRAERSKHYETSLLVIQVCVWL